MADVLNLALKKDIFEGLKAGVANQIPIDKSPWWKKRLMDENTGRFKPFKQVIASCGSADKDVYDIEKIELVNETFIITVVNNNKPKQEVDYTPQDAPLGENNDVEPVYPEQINPEVINPVTVETETKDGEEVEITVKKPYERPEITVIEDQEVNEPEYETEEEVPEKKDVRQLVTKLINEFCESKNVFVVNTPKVTIRYNGQIVGTTRRLVVDRDSDVMFEFTKKIFVHHPGDPESRFMISIVNYLALLAKSNYVFFNKLQSGFVENQFGDLIYTIVAVGKRKYLFRDDRR